MVHSVSAGEDPARHYGRERRGRFPTYALAIVLAFFIGGRIFQTALLFTDQTTFETAVGPGLVTEDFQGVSIVNLPFGAFSNSTSFQGFTLTPLTFPTHIPLIDAGLNPTGLMGTFLTQQAARPLSARADNWPAGDPADNDNFRFGLTSPALAFGLPIFNNRNDETRNSIQFTSADDINITLVQSLPGGANNPVPEPTVLSDYSSSKATR